MKTSEHCDCENCDKLGDVCTNEELHRIERRATSVVDDMRDSGGEIDAHDGEYIRICNAVYDAFLLGLNQNK